MASLPDSQIAVVDRRKLRDYCLDPLHPRGRHKARLFRAALGLEQGDTEWLATAIAEALPETLAIADAADHYGTRWRTDMMLDRDGRSVSVRAIWLVPPDNSAPRLITCCVLPR